MPEHLHIAFVIHEDESAESDNLVNGSGKLLAPNSMLANHGHESGQKGGLTVGLVTDRLNVEHAVVGKGHATFKVHKGMAVRLFDTAVGCYPAMNHARLIGGHIGFQFTLEIGSVHTVKNLGRRSESESVRVAYLALAKYIVCGQFASRGFHDYNAHVYVVLRVVLGAVFGLISLG